MPDSDRYPGGDALESFEAAAFYFRRAVSGGHEEAKRLVKAGDIAGASRVIDSVVLAQQGVEAAEMMIALELRERGIG